MTQAVQLRKGTTSEHSTFTGLQAEATVDTTKKTLVVHDGSTAGGIPLSREDLSNANPSNLTTIVGADTASGDLFVVYDVSASAFKKITRDELNNAMEQDALASVAITGGSINGTTIGASTASTGAFTTLSASSTVTLSGGTANGVLYLNGSKVATSGSALTFDGSGAFKSSGSTNGFLSSGTFVNSSNGSSAVNRIQIGNDASDGSGQIVVYGSQHSTLSNVMDINNAQNAALRFLTNNTEGMRLTSTSLYTASGINVGIGTSSPGYKLDVRVSPAAGGAAGAGVTTGSYEATLLVTGSTYNNYGVGANSAWLYTATNDLAIGPYGGSGIVKVVTGGATRATFDASGNLGLGVTPSGHLPAGYGGPMLQVGERASILGSTTTSAYTNNTYYASGFFRYIGNDEATMFEQLDGAFRWLTAASGTAGNAISFTQALTLDANRNLLLNGTTAGTSSVGTFAIFNGTAPTGSVTNGCILYAEDVSSSSELKVRDEAGNVTTLSPHNFSLIPEGPSEDMAWSYYSERDGKRINIDMLKAIRLLEKISGEQLVYES
jgi:hypothetical protein